VYNKHQIVEEPDEVKVSRPVLKTSGAGDSLAEFNEKRVLEKGKRVAGSECGDSTEYVG
jgi:hypothetical protein